MDAPPAQGNESEDTICSDLRERFERDDDAAALAGLTEFYGRAYVSDGDHEGEVASESKHQLASAAH